MSLVIFTEERSMKTVMHQLLPQLGVNDFRVFAFDGAGDLEASLRSKLRKWTDSNARFLIIRDNDRGNCRARKQRLDEIVRSAGSTANYKIRIVCQELEAWFLGDPEALEAAGYLKVGSRPSFCRRNPDDIVHPVHEMRRLAPDYNKGIGASKISPHLKISTNRSASFHNTVQAVRDLAAA